MQADTPEPVYGMPSDLEQLLDGAVLAVAAVQGDERDVGRARRAAASTRSCADVDRDDLVAEALQRVLDPRAGAQRDLALERAAALEDRDAAHRASVRRPGDGRGGRCSTSARSGSGAGASVAAGAAPALPVSVP